VKRLLFGGGVAAAALALLALATYDLHWFHHLDARALARLSADREGRLGDLADVVIYLGDPPAQTLLLVAGAAIALVSGRRRAALAGVVLVLGADLTTVVLKQALAAPRLDAVLGWAQVGEDSFPSGHATAAFSMLAAWLLFVPPGWRRVTAIVGAVIAGAVAASVVVLRHHFPSDVVGGLLVAAAWTCGVCAVLQLCTSAQEKEPHSASFEA
jgi:membrane-associated phospholipid phosphatase